MKVKSELLLSERQTERNRAEARSGNWRRGPVTTLVFWKNGFGRCLPERGGSSKAEGKGKKSNSFAIFLSCSNTGLAKKFVCVFPYHHTEKLKKNFLANPILLRNIPSHCHYHLMLIFMNALLSRFEVLHSCFCDKITDNHIFKGIKNYSVGNLVSCFVKYLFFNAVNNELSLLIYH